MKTLVGLVVLAVVFSSCMSHSSCPTYDGVKGRTASMATAKKSKPVKDRTPFYKLVKLAEVD